ncbi:unnamed protein product [Nippostrongylus brasiliensis]|uniref:Uncharacterized protein n=1 Tax=Nippostrongylus brasiliensis TaxID=27835 RepID=A0A0N4YP52_NIPBR|nr:unnamed protein product [Nippostrongylus brasiliensis]
MDASSDGHSREPRAALRQIISSTTGCRHHESPRTYRSQPDINQQLDEKRQNEFAVVQVLEEPGRSTEQAPPSRVSTLIDFENEKLSMARVWKTTKTRNLGAVVCSRKRIEAFVLELDEEYGHHA